jgi:hypothetical protein
LKKYILPILFIILFALNAFATVTIETNRVQYNCNGTTTAYTYPFEILEDDDLLVIATTSSGVESTLVLNTDYTVAGEGTSTGGTLTLTAGSKCPSGYTLTMLRNVELQQQTDYVDGASFSAESLENAIDKQTLIQQQQQEQLNRALKVEKSSTLTDLKVIPQGGKVIGFDAAGTGLTTYNTTALTSNDFVNLTDYGATLSAAITAIGSTEVTAVCSSAMNIGGNVTIPANVHLWALKGCAITTTGYTLTFTGTLEAGGYQIFSGTGTVNFSDGSTVYPEWWGATTTGDNATALQAAFTAAAHGTVKLTKLFTSSSAITLSHYTTVEGNGLDTGISFDHTGDGLNSTWTINSSTAANIHLKNLSLINTNGANTGGGFVDVGGTYVTVDNCYFSGWAYGVIFDQTEIASISKSQFVSNTTAGIWLVNGADHTALASPNYTNVIEISGNQFNLNATHIIDDGGTSHAVRNNNFNGSTTGNMRVSGVYNLRIEGNQSETGTAGIWFEDHTSVDSTYVGHSYSVIINNNNLQDSGVSYCVGVDYVHGLIIEGNNVGAYSGAAVLMLNTTSNIASDVVIRRNSKTIVGTNKTADPFLNGSAAITSRVNTSEQVAYTYVVVAQAGIGAIQATPANMEFIHIGTRLMCINTDGTGAEEVTVTAVDATTFTATFTSAKLANYLVVGANGGSDTGTLTLTANAATSTILNNTVKATSKIFLTPTSANAAADQGSATGVWVSTKTANTSFVLTHPNNANADKTFDYVIKD